MTRRAAVQLILVLVAVPLSWRRSLSGQSGCCCYANAATSNDSTGTGTLEALSNGTEGNGNGSSANNGSSSWHGYNPSNGDGYNNSGAWADDYRSHGGGDTNGSSWNDGSDDGAYAGNGSSASTGGGGDGNVQQQPPPTSGNGGGGGDAYEFVAFILWYIFLVLCCIIPTCFAYRRRRMMEAERVHRHHQESLHRFQQQSLYFLSSIQASNADHNEQALAAIRTGLLETELQHSTQVVEESDLIDASSSSGPTPLAATSPDLAAEPSPRPSLNGMGALSASSLTDLDGERANRFLRIRKNLGGVASASSPPSPVDAASTSAAASTLPAAMLTVPGTCAICLCPYETGERVSYSPLSNCTHAFHTDCIVTWLSRKDEPKCPVCRQTFCNLTMPTAPLAMSSSAASASTGTDPSSARSFYSIRSWATGSTGGGSTARTAATATAAEVRATLAAPNADGVRGSGYLPSFFTLDSTGRLVLVAAPPPPQQPPPPQPTAAATAPPAVISSAEPPPPVTAPGAAAAAVGSGNAASSSPMETISERRDGADPEP